MTSSFQVLYPIMKALFYTIAWNHVGWAIQILMPVVCKSMDNNAASINFPEYQQCINKLYSSLIKYKSSYASKYHLCFFSASY